MTMMLLHLHSRRDPLPAASSPNHLSDTLRRRDGTGRDGNRSACCQARVWHRFLPDASKKGLFFMTTTCVFLPPFLPAFVCLFRMFPLKNHLELTQ